MPINELQSDYREGSTIYLTGYTSTTKSFDVAKKFAFKNSYSQNVASCPSDSPKSVAATTSTALVPTIFLIKFYGVIGKFEMTHGYSAYPLEGETLLQDGLGYTVESCQENLDPETGLAYYIISITYKEQKKRCFGLLK